MLKCLWCIHSGGRTKQGWNFYLLQFLSSYRRQPCSPSKLYSGTHSSQLVYTNSYRATKKNLSRISTMSHTRLEAIPEENSWAEVSDTINALGKHPHPPKGIYLDIELSTFLVERVKSKYPLKIRKSKLLDAHTGLFARKDIEAGDEIFRTIPLVSCLEPGLIPEFCDYCKSARNRQHERNWKPVWCDGCGLCAYCSKVRPLHSFSFQVNKDLKARKIHYSI